MTNQETERLKQSLSHQQFCTHDVKVVLTILEGEGVYNQEDIIDTSEHNISLLRKLGWFRKVKKAVKDAGLNLCLSNQ